MTTKASGVCLELDGICGSSPEEVAESMIIVASNVGCMVAVSFNGIQMLAQPNDSVDSVLNSFRRAARYRQ